MEIVLDKTGEIVEYVCKGLNYARQEVGDNLTFGFVEQGELIGGLIFHNFRPQIDVWWTIYTTNKRWCSRFVLRKMFALAFEKMHSRRINLLVTDDNKACLHLVEKLGFKKEGHLRKFRDNGQDCYFLGMLKEECSWLK